MLARSIQAAGAAAAAFWGVEEAHGRRWAVALGEGVEAAAVEVIAFAAHVVAGRFVRLVGFSRHRPSGW